MQRQGSGTADARQRQGKDKGGHGQGKTDAQARQRQDNSKTNVRQGSDKGEATVTQCNVVTPLPLMLTKATYDDRAEDGLPRSALRAANSTSRTFGEPDERDGI